MKYTSANSLAVFLFALSQFAVAQSTVSITVPNCPGSTSCGPTTVQANQFAANGSGAGGLNVASGSAPAQAGVGIPANTIMLYAPSTVLTPYAIALTSTPSTSTPPTSGFWYGALPSSAATFTTPTVSGTFPYGLSISGTGVNTGGSNYLVPPPCFITTTTTPPSTLTPAACYFTLGSGLTAGQIANVYLSSNGANYTGLTPVVNAAPTMDLTYLTPSDGTNLLNSNYFVPILYGTPSSGHLGSFNSAGDLVDSGITGSTGSLSLSGTINNVTITAPATSATLTIASGTTETLPNVSSTLLSSVDGDGALLSSTGCTPSSAGVCSLSLVTNTTAGQTGIWNNGEPMNGVVNFGSTNTQLTNNTIYVAQLNVRGSPQVIGHSPFYVNTGESGTTTYICLYNAALTSLLWSAHATTTTSGTVANPSASQYPANPGTYYLAYGQTGNTTGISVYVYTGLNAETAAIENTNGTRFATSSTSMASGCPSGLSGTLTTTNVAAAGMVIGLEP